MKRRVFLLASSRTLKKKMTSVSFFVQCHERFSDEMKPLDRFHIPLIFLLASFHSPSLTFVSFPRSTWGGGLELGPILATTRSLEERRKRAARIMICI